jgi:hypothetical protein
MKETQTNATNNAHFIKTTILQPPIASEATNLLKDLEVTLLLRNELAAIPFGSRRVTSCDDMRPYRQRCRLLGSYPAILPLVASELD